MRKTDTLLRILLFLLAFTTSKLYSQMVYRDEFNGPFASWANVKTRFGAKGDGIKDDTKALQLAIDSLSCYIDKEFNVKPSTRYVVIYLPAGTYKISKTLRVEGKIGFSIIGEDPAKTIIKWAGSDKDTMLVLNGSSYYKVSRLTWHADKARQMEAIGVHWLDKKGIRFASTSIELSDMIFKEGFSYGIYGGTFAEDGTGANDAEITIKRCRFLGCTEAGIAIKGFNALDYWIWDSEFINCARGIRCNHGNFHVYYSSFLNSSVGDIDCSDAYYTSVRGCYSRGAKLFSFDEGASCNPFKRIFQQNIVENCKGAPIEYHSQGKVTMLDNYFLKSGSTATLNYSTWCPAIYEVLSLGNYFEDSIPHNLPRDRATTIFSVEDKRALATSRIKKLSPRMPQPFIPLVKRKVFEVPPRATATAIQTIITRAAQLAGQRPVVHFPAGIFAIDAAIDIPSGCDMQIIGDGILGATVLERRNDGNCFNVHGPSYITIQDLQVKGTTGSTGLTFAGIDQPSSEVHLDQIYSDASTTLQVDGLNYAYIEKDNSFYSAGNRVNGGKLMVAGKGTSKVYCFGGQSVRTTLTGKAVFVAKDCWWEGAFKNEFLPIDLEGDGQLTIDGALIAPRDMDSTTTIRIKRFKGNVTLSDMYMYGGIDVNNNNSDLNLLLWNIHFMKKQDPAAFIKPGFKPRLAMLGVTTQCFKTETKSCVNDNLLPLPDVERNVSNNKDFLNIMARDMRSAMPRPFTELTRGTSNVYISRVSVQHSGSAFQFKE